MSYSSATCAFPENFSRVRAGLLDLLKNFELLLFPVTLICFVIQILFFVNQFSQILFLFLSNELVQKVIKFVNKLQKFAI